MFIPLTKQEIQLLEAENIEFSSSRDYSDNEAFDFLDLVRDVEVFYSQDADTNEVSKKRAIIYGNLADKIQGMIPEV